MTLTFQQCITLKSSIKNDKNKKEHTDANKNPQEKNLHPSANQNFKMLLVWNKRKAKPLLY